MARLRAAGFVIVGRTNMTEFAYSGLGLNPHYGTPRNPWDRATGRIPGGSSSGAAVSVTDGMAYAALGTDTGGSCRIPAAYCGIAGWKPTASRVPQQGVLPLSFSLDSVGCLAASVDDCAAIDAIVAGGEATGPVQRVRYVAACDSPRRRPWCSTASTRSSGAPMNSALSRIAAAGATIETIPLAELQEIGTLSAKGGFPAAEAYAWHRKYLETQRDRYDPRVSVRILRGREQSAADYIDLVQGRADLIARVRAIAPGLRCAGDADGADRGAGHRRIRKRRGLCETQHPVASQSDGGELPRSLRDLAAGASQGRRTGRADAGRQARRGRDAAADREGGGRAVPVAE